MQAIVSAAQMILSGDAEVVVAGGVEVMSSPTAARTYNVLLGEGRRVAVALLPVEGPQNS